MRPITIRKSTLVVLALVVVCGAVSLPLAAGTAVAQEDTADNSTNEACNELPEMDQTRLYTPEPTVTSGQAGEIEGAFELDPQADCPVVVDISLRVPSGMTISGGTDWQEAEAGIVATEFTMDPDGSSLEGLSANVYSEETGPRTVDAQIEYWPEGSPELAQTIDTTRLTFQVEEPNPEGSSGGSGIDISIPELTPIQMIFILALTAVAGIIWVFPKINIE